MKRTLGTLAALAAFAFAGPATAQWEWEDAQGEWVYNAPGQDVEFDPVGSEYDTNYNYGTDLYDDDWGYDYGYNDWGDDTYDAGFYDTGYYDTDYGFGTGYDYDYGYDADYDYDYGADDDWWDWW